MKQKTTGLIINSVLCLSIIVFIATIFLSMSSYNIIAYADNIPYGLSGYASGQYTRTKEEQKDYNGLITQIKEESKKALEKHEEIINELKKGEEIADVAQVVIAFINDGLKNGIQMDYANNIYEVLGSVVKLACLFTGGPVAATMAESIIGVIKSVLSIGDGTSQSEIQRLESAIKEQFDLVNDNLYEVNNNIKDLSNNIDKSTAIIIEAIKNAVETTEAKAQLISFFSSGSGNFDFNLFKQYLYGDSTAKGESYSRYAYYSQLIDVLSDDSSTAIQTKEAFDNLYKHLDAQVNHNQKTPIEMFYDYLLEDGFAKKSIQHYYYDCLYYFEQANAEYNTFDFMIDLYETALFADLCLTKCNMYQLLTIIQDEGENLNDYSKYYYGKGEDEYIYYRDILEKNNAIALREIQLKEQMLMDLSYILHIDKSYFVEEPNGLIRNVKNVDNDTFGNVQNNATIYLNKYSNNLIEMFDIDLSLFKYQWLHNGILLDENDGLLNLTNTSYDNITARVLYKDSICYSIDFTIGNKDVFYGGDGSLYNPYIVSSPEQLKMISNHPDMCYQLIGDIDLFDNTITPLASKQNKLTGYVDGNGYTISNFSINTDELGGLFGYIGQNGIVSNLSISNCTITVHNDSVREISAGAFAGVCEGVLYNCRVFGNVRITCKIEGTEQTSNLNKAIYSNVGGLVGKLSLGIVSDCSVETNDDSSLYGETHRLYDANSDSSNKSFVCVGGVAGQVTNGKISSCYVANGLSINAYGYSACKKALSTRYPSITIRGGGIAGSANNADIANVYSEAEITYKSSSSSITQYQYYYVDNLADFGFAHYNSCSVEFANYIPEYSDETINRIKAKNKEDIGSWTEKSVYNIGYDFNSSKNIDYDFCYEDQLYECGEKNLKTDNLIITINGVQIDEYEIISVFDFDTYNSNHLNHIVKSTKILFSFADKGKTSFAKLLLPITIKENKPARLFVNVPTYIEKVECENNYYTLYELDDVLFSKDESVLLYYQNGSYKNVTNEAVLSNNKTSNVGIFEVTVSFDNLATVYSVFVRCNMSFEEYEAFDTIPPTCSSVGYTIYRCSICGDTCLSDTVPRLTHSFVVSNQLNPSCTHEGYTGDTICSECGYVSDSGKLLQKLEHNYNCFDENYHICKDCNDMDNHILVPLDNTDGKIIYYCTSCEYFNAEIVDFRNASRVIVSNASVLSGGYVQVFVQLLNNPGIAGASCSIIYDPKLDYVSSEKGNLLPNAELTVTPVKKGLVNFTMVQTTNDNSEYGVLFKLTFKCPEDVGVGTEYYISTGYTKSKEQFIKQNSSKVDIISVKGTITVVDRLPGDVNDDGYVDVLDSTLIALACNNSDGVNDELLSAANYSAFYADVDLSGDVSINDMLAMFQYFFGGFNVQLYSGSFKLNINLNDGKSPSKIVTVFCKDEDGNDKVWGDIDELSIVQRDGYRFDGWYTYDGERVSLEDTIIEGLTKFDKTSSRTLYAHWTLNKVFFADNGATDGNIPDYITYFNMGTDKYIFSNALEREYTVTFNNGRDLLIPELTRTVKYNFEGWALDPTATVPDYRIGDSIPLKSSFDSKGEFVLYAVWSVFPISLPDPNLKGVVFLGWYKENEKVGKIGDSFIPTEPVELTAKYNASSYSIKFAGNGGKGSMNDIPEVFYSTSDKMQLPINEFTKTGYVFEGWSVDSDSTFVEYLDGEIINKDLTESNSIWLYAIWKPVEYEIILDKQNNTSPVTLFGRYGVGLFADKDYNDTVYKIDVPRKEGYVFFGYYDYVTNNSSTSANGGAMMINEDGEVVFNVDSIYNDLSVFALWKPIESFVTFVTNGGSVPKSTIKVVYDGTTELPTPVYNSAHIFDGWYTDSDFNNKFSGLLNSLKNDIVLYAKWLDNSIVVYDGAIRTYEEKIHANHSVTEKFTLYKTIADLKNEGYTRLQFYIGFNIREEDDCFQFIRVYTDNNEELFNNVNTPLSHGGFSGYTGIFHKSGNPYLTRYDLVRTPNLTDFTSSNFNVYVYQNDSNWFRDYYIGTIYVKVVALP